MMKSIKDNKFIGFQGILCAIAGIIISIVLDKTEFSNVSMAVGLIIAITLLLLCIGQNLLSSQRFWIFMVIATSINVACGFIMYPYRNFHPIQLFPFLLIEVIIFIACINRLNRAE